MLSVLVATATPSVLTRSVSLSEGALDSLRGSVPDFDVISATAPPSALAERDRCRSEATGIDHDPEWAGHDATPASGSDEIRSARVWTLLSGSLS